MVGSGVGSGWARASPMGSRPARWTLEPRQVPRTAWRLGVGSGCAETEGDGLVPGVASGVGSVVAGAVVAGAVVGARVAIGVGSAVGASRGRWRAGHGHGGLDRDDIEAVGAGRIAAHDHHAVTRRRDDGVVDLGAGADPRYLRRLEGRLGDLAGVRGQRADLVHARRPDLEAAVGVAGEDRDVVRGDGDGGGGRRAVGGWHDRRSVEERGSHHDRHHREAGDRRQRGGRHPEHAAATTRRRSTLAGLRIDRGSGPGPQVPRRLRRRIAQGREQEAVRVVVRCSGGARIAGVEVRVQPCGVGGLERLVHAQGGELAGAVVVGGGAAEERAHDRVSR